MGSIRVSGRPPAPIMSLARLSRNSFLGRPMTSWPLPYSQIRSMSNTLLDHAGLVRPAPPRTCQAGLLKAFLTSAIGLYTGAFISQNMAAFLEENELFVPEDDDDDD